MAFRWFLLRTRFVFLEPLSSMKLLPTHGGAAVSVAVAVEEALKK